MATSVNDKLLDRAIRHSIFMSRVSAGKVKMALKFLEAEFIPDLIGKVSSETHRLEGTRSNIKAELRKVKTELQRFTSLKIDELREEMDPSFKELVQSEAKFQTKLLDDVVPVDVDFTTPSPRTLNAVLFNEPMRGEVIPEWYKRLSKSTSDRVYNEISIGILEGESNETIVRRIRGTKANRFKDGVLQRTRNDVSTFVRTATNHTNQVARSRTYESNSNIIKGRQYIATLDGRTSLICISLDGKVFPIDSGPRAPQHHNCRSSDVPVIKSFRELGIKAKDIPETTRASMNGQVAAKVTYPQWLKKQPLNVQNEVLGVKKAQIFRRGKLKIDRFMADNGRPLTVAELLDLETSLS